MAAEIKKIILLLALTVFLFPLPAQEEEPAADNTDAVVTDEEPVEDYYYVLNDAGEPVFTQVIAWKAQKGALEYEVILESVAADGSAAELLREKTAEDSLTVNLTPGQYRYRIIVYNLLGKPEIEAPWKDFTVIKAEFPKVESLFPFSLYMEEEQFNITVRGGNILPGAEFHMVDQGTGILIFKAVELERYKNETIELQLPRSTVGYGNYRVKVVNPGGLFDTTETVLKIRYKKPVDIVLTAGYAPAITLYDDWFTANWSEGFYPVGFTARADFFFLKRRIGFFGVGAVGRFIMLEGGTDEATLTTLYAGMGLNVVYKLLLNNTFHLVFRLGGGAAWSRHGFDYEGSEGPEMASWDPYGTVGVSAQIILKKRWIIEPGVDLFNVFHSSYNAGMLCPYITGGVQF
jgi:hypothetical protein